MTIGKIKIAFIIRGKKNAEGFQYRARMKIMITGFNFLAAVSASGKRANIYGCLGINGYAKYPVGFIGDAVRCMDIGKDFICLSYFFLGLHLSTFFRWNPNWFNLLLTVRIVGN